MAKQLKTAQRRLRHRRPQGERRARRALRVRATCSCSRARPRPSATSPWRRWRAASASSPTTTRRRAQYLRHGESALLAPFGDAATFIAHAERLASDPALARAPGRGRAQRGRDAAPGTASSAISRRCCLMWRLDAALARLQHWDERRLRPDQPRRAPAPGRCWPSQARQLARQRHLLVRADAGAARSPTRSGAALPVLHMAFVGAVCTCCYKMVKRTTVRARPYEVQSAGVGRRHGRSTASAFPPATRCTPSPSRSSPASTTRAVRCCWCRSRSLTALSRVALGLHYPSDVLAGAALGALIAGASFAVA